MARQTKEKTHAKLESKLADTVRKNQDLRNALLLVHSDRLDIHWKFGFGTTKGQPISADNPYHIASIGKTFTSVIMARLYEKGLIQYDHPVSKYLSSDLLAGLFVYQGTDYTEEVLVRHLLNHTSGIADYYEDPPIEGASIQELLVGEPERFWKPEETIAYTRDNQRAFSIPGKRFHYSDTGYNLLGKIVENITARPFHESLDAEILEPLGMADTYFLFYSEPKAKSPYQIADTFLGEHEVSTYRSLSIDWAGGGIVSTTEDLLRFHKALVDNTLVTRATWELCTTDRGRFGFGMDYGYGVLFLNVRQMTIILPGTLNMWGNLGSIAAYMFYNPAHDVFIIGSFNQSKYVARQVNFLIDAIRRISKLGR